jgi:hypothetical protein
MQQEPVHQEFGLRWGYHLDDINLVLGDLVRDSQAA